jgi:hypothetical protein
LVNEFIDYLHDSELQTITTLSLIYTVYKSLHAESSPACSFTNHCLVTNLNNRDSSASVVRPLPAVQHSITEPSTKFPASLAELKSQANYSVVSSQTQLSTDCVAEQSRAEQSRAVAYCRQPASTVTLGIEPRWGP